MSRNNHNEPSQARVVRYSYLLLLVAWFAMPPAHALDTGDIVIVGLKGEVHVVMKGAERAVKAGTVLELPATVQTGRDGGIDLRQGETSVSVGPDTLLEFPALEKAGGPIDRIVQPRGNAFYSIGKRAGRKLRVETPYLVGVVKGTQFNVAAGDEATTISLFEGLLEIRASDDSSQVDIKAGEVATRARGDAAIGVMKMDAGATPAPRAPSGSRGNGGGSPSPGSLAPRGIPATRDVGNVQVSDVVDTRLDPLGTNPAAGPSADVRGAAGIAATADTVGATGVNVAVAAEVGNAAVDVNAGVATNVTAAAIEVSTGTGGVDAAAGVAVAAGPVAVDAGVNAGVELGGGAASVDLGAASGVNAGNAAVDMGAGAAMD